MTAVEDPTKMHAIVTVLAVTVPIVLGGLPVAGQTTSMLGPASGQPPRHDPIRIEGDQDLLVPPPVGDDDGVRRGTGTADDPFVIEDWTIEHPETEPAILVQDTTMHLVIQNVRFDGQISLERISVERAENVTIRNLTIDSYNKRHTTGSPPDLLWVRMSDNVVVRNLSLDGNVRFGFERNRDVRIEDIRHAGPQGYMTLAGGTYRMRDVSFEYGFDETGDAGGGTANGKIRLGVSEQAPDEGPCSLHAKNISIQGAGGLGIEVSDSLCRAVLRDVEVTSSEAGVVAHVGARVDLVEATLRYIHDSRDPPSPGYRHGIAGLRADLEFMGGAGSLNSGENAPGTIAARNVTIDGYWHGVTSRGGGFDLEDVRIQGHRIGVYASGACDPCQIHDSSILGSQDMHVLNEGSSTVDARRNWWGSADGPPDDMVEGDVLVEPWKTEGPAPPSQAGEGLPSFGVVLALVAASVAAGVRRRDP